MFHRPIHQATAIAADSFASTHPTGARARAWHAFKSLSTDQAGLSTVEYVILLALIGAVSIGTWNELGGTITGALRGAHEEFDTQLSSPAGAE
jgi:Flp pilus assembly pilin Flp